MKVDVVLAFSMNAEKFQVSWVNRTEAKSVFDIKFSHQSVLAVLGNKSKSLIKGGIV